MSKKLNEDAQTILAIRFGFAKNEGASVEKMGNQDSQCLKNLRGDLLVYNLPLPLFNDFGVVRNSKPPTRRGSPCRENSVNP